MSNGMAKHGAQAVLVVDDDPCSLLLISKQLSKAGYTVYTANSGAEALEILVSDAPPIIVTDWVMPEMDGLELCRTIRSHDGIRYAFVIIVTAHEADERDERIVSAFEAGADDYLTKPVNRRELLARLRAAHRIIRLQQNLDERSMEVHRANAEMAVAQAKLEEANHKLHIMATTDELTGVLNRRQAMVKLREHWAMHERHGDPLACVLLDIDHFKRFNDTHGHAVGDIVLKNIAGTLRTGARSTDSVCRFGGEEFLVICPKANEEAAGICAERLRRLVEANTICAEGRELRLTISLGVAEAYPDSDSPEALLREADAALYAAKGRGRNCVVLARHAAGATSEPQQPSPDAARDVACPSVPG